jgi:hypothetical protein
VSESRIDDEERVGLWADGHLTVAAYLKGDGRLVFTGQHLSVVERRDAPDGQPSGPQVSEYEYALTVAAGDVPAVCRALQEDDGEPDDVLTLLSTHAATVVGAGELTWLRSIGIEPEFWSRAD